MPPESRIRVLTLNCWGLKYVAKNLEVRLEAIAHELANCDHDIIALQEIWVYAHYQRVQQRVSKKLPYSKFFHSGALGSGLAIFTRYPIVSAGIRPYSLNGTPLDVAGGDWFVGKAAAHVVILHPILGEVQVFNTHFIAKGGEDGPEFLRAHRLVNAWEFSKLVRQAADLGKYVIACGDFNGIPHTLPMTLVREHANLSDAWVVTHPREINASQISSPAEAIQRLGITADSPLNSWSAAKPYARGTLGKRLDYVFYRQPNRPGQSVPVLEAVDTKVVFTDLVRGERVSYSDHFGLEATFDIKSEATDGIAQTQLPTMELSGASISTTIDALTTCYRFSRLRSRRELMIFGLCILILLGVVIGTAWLPHSWINPIFILFTIFIAWLATTMLYEGFIFGNWECNALMNVIEELEIHRKGMDIFNGRANTS